MIATPAFEDYVRIFTPQGEVAIQWSQVKAVLRKAPTSDLAEGLQLSRHFPPSPAVGIELQSGEIIWSDGETDWYFSGQPSRIGN
jgi:hypothetical protein